MRFKNFSILFLITLLASLIMPLEAIAQLQPNFIQFQTERGLQSNTIYNLHVAKNGLLYIAHSKGLSSFDGNHFTNYYNKERPFIEVTNIIETSNGDIFCKTFNNTLFRKTGDSLRWFSSITPYSYGFAASSAYKNEVYSLTNDSLIVVDATTNKKMGIALSSSRPLVAKQHIQFIGTGNSKGMQTVFLVNDKKQIFQLPQTAYHYCNGDLFLLTSKSLSDVYFYNFDERINIRPPKENTNVNFISTTDSMIWICTTNGLFYRNKFNKGGSFTYILNGYDISDVKQTKEGNYFIATIGQGLFFVPNFNVNKLDNIPNNITSISGYDDHLLLGTKESAVLDYQVTTSRLVPLQEDDDGTAVRILFRNGNDGPTFISTSTTLIAGKTYPFIIKDYCVVKNSVVLATNMGVFLYEAKNTGHWLHKYIINSDANDSRLKKLCFSNEHTATIKYNSQNDRLYLHNSSGVLEMADGYKDAVKLPEPNCVLKDMCIWNGALLLASKDKGLLRWNGKKYEAAFTKDQTTGILYKFEMYKNELWILGEDAVFCYKDDKLHTYNMQAGINAENISGLYVTEEMVYANTGNSIIRFLKDNAISNTSSPGFVWNKIMNVNAGKAVQENSSLPYNENFVSFQFSLIAYANSANTHIAYSVNNESIIHLPADRREISLNFLKPQHYSVAIYIVRNGITPLKPATRFSFTVDPPFYNTWWFYTLCAIATGGGIYWTVSRRIAKERAALALKESKLLLEKELDKTTLSGIKAQMNPHFIFNALNTIQSYVYMNDKKKAGIYISKFSDLTRSILENSNKERITLAEEINALQLYLSLEKMRFEESFDYSITSADDVSNERITIPSMLLQPYVENAIKHGLLHRKTNRKLLVSFTVENGYLRVVIDDNGIGRKRSMELNRINSKNHNSFAMSANKKRLDILKQQHSDIVLEIIDKYTDHGEASGTQIIINLPVGDDE